MKKKINVGACVAGIISVVLFSFAFANIAHAETRLDEMTLAEDTVWDKENSPYILSGQVTVPQGITLRIMPGAEVIGENLDEYAYTGIYVNGGSLLIRGERGNFVKLSSLTAGIDVEDGKFSMERTHMTGFYGIFIENGQGVIATSTLENSEGGIDIISSRVIVTGSRMKDMRQGFRVRDEVDKPYQVNSIPTSNVGGEGNAFDLQEMNMPLSVSNTSITNTRYSLTSFSTSTIGAKNNWWGSSSGPVIEGDSGGVVFGFVSYDPWLLSEPEFDPADTVVSKCCSSVLFLPGLEATELFRKQARPLGLGNSTNQLWAPNRNKDVQKLFLNPVGSSTDPLIYSGEPIGKVFGVFDIYAKFMTFMDGLTTKGTIQEWTSYGYDWRKPIDLVVTGGQQKSTTTESLLATVSELATRSKTGKVTIIAHSNGGLVAKYLVNKLNILGQSGLIDKVISVAVPYIGTPQAIAAILHGDDQEIGKGYILNQSTARQLGLNMPSAYSLLPSAKYFEKFLGPTIAFASSNIPGLNRGSYSQNIVSADMQNAFITDSGRVRVKPKNVDVESPAKGSTLLINAAGIIHGIIDPMIWPTEIARYALVGWNKFTTKKVMYASADNYNLDKTNMGDGTVVVGSASYDAGKVGYLDLGALSLANKSDIKHARILESNEAQTAIETAITGSETEWCGKIEKIPGVSCGEPDYTKEIGETDIVVSTHSPVELHVYDEEGNHTGIIPPTPELIAETLAEGEGLDDMVTLYENNIIGSDFDANMKGTGDIETSISLPDDGRKYKIEIRGIGVGTFTYDVEKYNNGDLVGKAEYVNVPVTPLTVATTTIRYALGTTSASLFASSTTPLWVDTDGDGDADIKALPNKSIKQEVYIAALQRLFKRLGGNDTKSKKILARLELVLKSFEQAKQKKEVSRNQNEGDRHVTKHIKYKLLGDKDRQDILDDLEKKLILID
ncbi:MAG: hypothetical protein WCV79_00030 [Candidatus Paceibacterota bacterium]